MMNQIRITPVAIEAFKRLLKLSGECSCPPVPKAYWTHQRCAACLGMDEQRTILHSEFRCMPWEVGEPVLAPGCGEPDSRWDELARQRWLALERAVEAERTR